ncbi:MAG: hypothetical protein EPN37_11635 [Chitinophagaceae bacterium]|nr:MAG: hypothetical protein EPN37_11635 [Chitinophagaceae bacterium]
MILRGGYNKILILAKNYYSDHVHLFVGLKPPIKICDLVRDIMMRNIYFNGLNDFRNSFTRQRRVLFIFLFAHATILTSATGGL